MPCSDSGAREANTLPVLPDVSECSGECCAGFQLPYSPEDIFASDKEGLLYRLGHMVIYLGYGETPRGAGCNKHNYPTNPNHWYTCVHYDRENRRCLNYENRPSLCSEYPYGHECLYKGCTLRGSAGVEEHSGACNTHAKVPSGSNGCPECGRLGQLDRRYKHAPGTPVIPSCNKCNSNGSLTGVEDDE